ncbi:MAG: nucleotidyltransferase domain-containing protein [Deltaproteobacteria bacterium HGW-Deltaproteobacteria-15]|nr:MAG: nucleotidyltransferase domain-containing protein [Deltaproteobacteria bacterium HGW-Deltaproteobacteria-15]
MNLRREVKEKLKEEIVAGLASFPEVQRVVVFGSFVTSDDPHDMDIAIFQDSDESYYPLAMKYRRTLRSVAKKIPLDVIPIRRMPEEGPFMQEIQKGEVMYER